LSWDRYAQSLPEDKQKIIYELMVESRKSLIAFVSQKLFSEVTKIFGEKAINEHGEYKPFTNKSIEKWLKQKGHKDSWKNIGFSTSIQDNQYVGFVLGVDFAYFGTYDNVNSISSAENKSKNQVLGKNARELLLDNPEGIYMFVNEIEKKAVALGFKINDAQDIEFCKPRRPE